jgi:Ras-related protein Rab-32
MAGAEDAGSQYLYKVLVVGDYAVGKTSLIRRYCTGEFTANYRITIGVDFCVKTLDNFGAEGRNISLQLWDIAGHERFGAMTRVYYKFAIAAVVVFDLTRMSTLDSAKKWRQDINEKVVLPNDKPIPMILLANKCDLPDVAIPAERLDRFVEENGFMGWIATSAKSGTNIEEAFHQLVNGILAIPIDVTPPKPSNDVVTMGAAKPRKEKEEKKCCGN